MTARARAAVALLFLAALAPAAPATGAIGLSEERELGTRFALEARRRLPFLREPGLLEYVRRVGAPLIARLDGQQFDYRFQIVRDEGLNAFAVPGGWVYVHSGLLTAVASEGELAGVLAHEIVHVHAHHVVRQQKQTALVNYGTLLGLFLGVVHPALGAGAAAAGAAAQLKYQREFEREADHVGLDLMQRAGFDPTGMPRFLRRVQEQQRLNPAQVPPYFLSHPLTDERVAALEKRSAAMTRTAPRADGEAELAAAQATVRVLTGPLQAVVETYRARLAATPESPIAHHLLGLVYLHGGQPDAAEPLLARAAAAGSARAYGDHGRALARLGRSAAAQAAFTTHLARYPDDPVVTVELARALLGAGEAARAAALLAGTLAINPELDDAEYVLAECRGKSGDPRGQWWHLARAFELRGELPRAERAYEKARDASPKDSPERAEVEEAMRLLRSTFGPLGG